MISDHFSPLSHTPSFRCGKYVIQKTNLSGLEIVDEKSKTVVKLEKTNGSIYDLSFTPESDLLIAAARTGVKAWNTKTGKLRWTNDDYGWRYLYPSEIDMSLDRTFFAFTTYKRQSGQSGIVTCSINGKDPKLLVELPGMSRGLCIEPNGTHLLVVSSDGRLRRISVGTGKVVNSWQSCRKCSRNRFIIPPPKNANYDKHR